MSNANETNTTGAKRRRMSHAREPKRRNRQIFERHVFEGETQERVAAAFGITQQRVAQIIARVDAWIATHPDDPLAQRMRSRTNRRWDAIWSRAMGGFDRSLEDRETKKERVVRHTISGEAGTSNSGETPLPQGPPIVTVSETSVRRQNGDPRYLTVAARVAEREDRMWQAADFVKSRSVAEGNGQNSHERRRKPHTREPKRRDRQIYERHAVEGETQARVAAAFGITQQRVGRIVAHVEAWIATHADDPLAQRMRSRASRRWDAIWRSAIDGFDRSQEDRETKKERVVRKTISGEAGTPNSGETPLPQGIPNSGETPLLRGGETPRPQGSPIVTVSETSIRRQNGDPRYLGIATRVAERDDRMWSRQEVADSVRSRAVAANSQSSHESCDARIQNSHERGDARFPCLPAELADLEDLACGLRDTESVPGTCGDGATSVPVLFERRCAQAFRCLGLEVTEQGQGYGRVADSLAVAVLEGFAVIIDAKVRRNGYTLGTDDRQFCEYATRHSRELALSGIQRVYFAVVGHGFRQQDLDKLAGWMADTPIRSVCFIEAAALMRLVNDSIARRREFRLDQLDRLLFGNKIIDEAMVIRTW